MSPAVKYTLGRLGLFVVVLVLLLPVPINFLVKAMIALIASAGFSFFLLAKWRLEMADHLNAAAQRRADEKKRLRAALAGDESAAAEGDRAAAADQPATAPGRAEDRAPAATGETEGHAATAAGETADGSDDAAAERARGRTEGI